RGELAVSQLGRGERGGESGDVADDGAFLRGRHSLTPPWPPGPSCISAAMPAAVFWDSFAGAIIRPMRGPLKSNTPPKKSAKKCMGLRPRVQYRRRKRQPRRSDRTI